MYHIIQLLNSLEESSVKKSLESTLNGKGTKSELYESKEQKTESYSKQSKTESRLEETKKSETSETKVTETAMAEQHTASLVTETARKVSFSSTTAETASTATRRKSSVAELTALLARRASGVQTLSESAEAKTHVLMYSGADLQSKSRTSSESLSATMRASREKSAEDKLEEIEGGNRPHFIKTIRGTSIERKFFSRKLSWLQCKSFAPSLSLTFNLHFRTNKTSR